MCAPLAERPLFEESVHAFPPDISMNHTFQAEGQHAVT